MNKPELTALMKMVGSTVREYVGVLAVKIADIQYKCDALDQRLKDIPAGQDGKDAVVDYDKVHALLSTEVQAAVKELPAAKDGAEGPIGPTGPKGENGDRGEKGDVGPTGEKGEPGLSIKGDPGLSIIGPAGPVGHKGEPGESVRGEKGESGIQGVPGEPGEKGEPGLSVKGDKGDPGINGKDAEPIHPDTLSLMVVTEVEKAVAKAVALIPKAVDGRDALQIDILPVIDSLKSYPRGVFAKHAGGLIRSIRSTDPFADGACINAGWEVVFSGLSGMTIRQDTDPRWFCFLTTLTGGIESATKLYIPALIYKGVFREATEYVNGDVVTWGGSAWHCQAESTKAKPGSGSLDWQLMVKEGRGGKDGTSGPEGPAGKSGRDGRDLTQVDWEGRKH